MAEDWREDDEDVDTDASPAGGWRRRMRTPGAALAAVALVLPVSAVVLYETASARRPAAPATGDCLFEGQEELAAFGDVRTGTRMTGTRWLDTGRPTTGRNVRVQVNTDTCRGIAIAIARGLADHRGGSTITSDVAGRPERAFWAFDDSGTAYGVDPDVATPPGMDGIVILLPEGQRFCGITTSPHGGELAGKHPTLIDPLTVPAGDGWQAVFATMPGVSDREGMTVQICAGSRVVEPARYALRSNVKMPAVASGGTTPEPVSCPDGKVNSGTVDYAAVPAGADNLGAHVSDWARATGFSSRYPSATLELDQQLHHAEATFVEDGRLRARLTYREVEGQWALVTLEYC